MEEALFCKLVNHLALSTLRIVLGPFATRCRDVVNHNVSESSVTSQMEASIGISQKRLPGLLEKFVGIFSLTVAW